MESSGSANPTLVDQNQVAVVLFDGVCNLCNGVVQWVIPKDPSGRFKFASQQSAVGQALLRQHRLPEMTSVVLVLGDQVFAKSDAVLGLVARLDAPWSWLGVFRVLPQGLRDLVYDFVARHRYSIFGRREACWLPRPEWRSRFLDVA